MDEGVVGGGVGGSRGGVLSDRSQVTAARQDFMHLQLIFDIMMTATQVCVSAQVWMRKQNHSSPHFPVFLQLEAQK